MAIWSKVSDRPSWAIESISFVSPYLVPTREPASRCGAWVIDSWPPATTMSNSPARMSWSASAMALRPERQTLFTVMAGTVIGMPAATAAGRAGFWPAPACSTCPMITYSTWSPEMPARSSAALIATAPRSAPEKSLSEPSSRPIGVRAPLTMTERDMICLQGRAADAGDPRGRSEEHTSELQSRQYLVCRLLLEKKKLNPHRISTYLQLDSR